VAQGHSYTAAAQASGRRSGDAVAQVVARFNKEGLSALTSRHAWLKQELTQVVNALPEVPSSLSSEVIRPMWQHWREALSVRFTLPTQLPPLRMLLVWDNLIGHQTPELMLWLCEKGILPLYTPLSGSWLNMAESMQRILKRRALDGQHPQTPQQIIERLETAAHVWNQHSTPFEWSGKRAARRQRARLKQQQHRLGGSGACTQTVSYSSSAFNGNIPARVH
jgi:hypothetical protein